MIILLCKPWWPSKVTRITHNTIFPTHPQHPIIPNIPPQNAPQKKSAKKPTPHLGCKASLLLFHSGPLCGSLGWKLQKLTWWITTSILQIIHHPPIFRTNRYTISKKNALKDIRNQKKTPKSITRLPKHVRFLGFFSCHWKLSKPNKSFSGFCSIPVAEIWLRHSDIICASCSFPGIFSPYISSK